ncbi:MAG TPA: hypothetical protein VN455_02465, partial [Methanotrichaceae archaeon]|nr:hypothetical protein [Methanotrichaceae archaeon]
MISMLLITYVPSAFATDDLSSSQARAIANSPLDIINAEKPIQPAEEDGAAKLVVQAARSRPGLKISNQNVEDAHGTAIIKEAFSIGPGWLVIYNDGIAFTDRSTHAQGLITGRARLHDGLNENVRVKLNMAFVTPKLYAVVHKDAGKVGTFEYPGPDYPDPLSSSGGVTRQFYSTWPYPKDEFPKPVRTTSPD